jgi:hypothetical protein
MGKEKKAKKWWQRTDRKFVVFYFDSKQDFEEARGAFGAKGQIGKFCQGTDKSWEGAEFYRKASKGGINSRLLLKG